MPIETTQTASVERSDALGFLIRAAQVAATQRVQKQIMNDYDACCTCAHDHLPEPFTVAGGWILNTRRTKYCCENNKLCE